MYDIDKSINIHIRFNCDRTIAMCSLNFLISNDALRGTLQLDLGIIKTFVVKVPDSSPFPEHIIRSEAIVWNSLLATDKSRYQTIKY